MADVDGPLGTGCKQHLARSDLTSFSRSFRRETRKDPLKELQKRSDSRLCRTMSGLLRGEQRLIAFGRAPIVSSVISLIAKEPKRAVWFSFAG